MIVVGELCIDPLARGVTVRGQPIVVGGRAFDLLLALAERPNAVVDKRDLLARIWPNLVVDEANLRMHVTALRKALGDSGARLIKNVPGRGYFLAAPSAFSDAAPRDTASAALPSLPALAGEIIGREDIVEVARAQLLHSRFLTIAGAGGIGKTTVAIALAHAVASQFAGGVHFLDLSQLGRADHLPAALAAALGLLVHTGNPVPAILAALRNRAMLLVFDSCEHVIDDAAALLDMISRESDQVCILATSREALRVPREQVLRLPPLDFPPEGKQEDPTTVLAYPAVRLFMARLTAAGTTPAPSAANAAMIGRICRQLDGIALAIELVAGRVDTYGLAGTAALLDSQFALQWRGLRTAVPRHQTMSAAIDWSYTLLTPQERLVFCRLSVLAGQFPLEAAQEVARCGNIGPFDVAATVEALVAKSLVVATETGGTSYFRLPDTARAYAAAKLAETTEGEAVRRRHAEFYANALRRTHGTLHGGADGLPVNARSEIDNALAALAWSFAPGGDTAVGAALAAAAAPLFLEVSWLGACRTWTETALAALGSHGAPDLEQALQGSLAVSLMFTGGDGGRVTAAFQRALALAEAAGDGVAQVRFLGGLYSHLLRVGEFRAAIAHAESSRALARATGDRVSIGMSEWMLSIGLHLLGDQAGAERHYPAALRDLPMGGRGLTRFDYDHRILILLGSARSHWLRGRGAQAVAVARQALAEAEALGHAVSMCVGFVYVASVFLWVGDDVATAHVIGRLLAEAERFSLASHHAVGVGLDGALRLQRGDVDAALPLLRLCVSNLHTAGYHTLSPAFSGHLAEALLVAGAAVEALVVLNDALALVSDKGGSFCAPELARIKGVVLATLGDPGGARACFEQAVAEAAAQSSPAWALRAAISATECLPDGHGTWLERVALYATACHDGLETADLRTAGRLLKAAGPV